MFNSALVMNNSVRFMYYYMSLVLVVHHKCVCFFVFPRRGAIIGGIFYYLGG